MHIICVMSQADDDRRNRCTCSYSVVSGTVHFVLMQVWQILSPFHSIRVHDYAVMLWHRVLWHAQLGVNHYLLYVYESLSPLLKEPLIQV